MADSFAPVPVPNDWIDLYSALGIGSSRPALTVFAEGGALKFSVSLTKPAGPEATNVPREMEVRIDAGLSGVWVRATTQGARALAQRSIGGIRHGSFFDPRVIDGNKAITTQSFTELNSKRGSQFEASFYVPTLASGATTHVAIEVGPDPMVVKNLALQFESEEINTQLFRDPVYTGGTEVPAYTFRDSTGLVSSVTILGGPTVTDAGTPVGPLTYTLGSDSAGSSQTLTSLTASSEAERILEPGGSYLLRINNSDGIATRIAGLATWYEGPLSTEIE